MPTKRVRRLLGVAAIAPLFLTSCDSNPFDPFDDVTGTYQLTVFVGRSVPGTITCPPGDCLATFPNGNGGTIRIHGGTLELDEDGTFVETNHWTETPSGGASDDVTFVSTGTYDVNFDNQLTLYAPPQNGLAARTLNATIEYGGNEVTIHYEEGGDSFEYQR